MSRIGCRHCNFRGYTKNTIFSGADGEEDSTSVGVCPHCKDTRGYSAYVKNKYGSNKSNLVLLEEKEPLADVIDFNEFKQRKKKDGE